MNLCLRFKNKAIAAQATFAIEGAAAKIDLKSFILIGLQMIITTTTEVVVSD